MSAQAIKLAVFDIDGTLTTVKSVWEHIHRELCLWEGVCDVYQEQFLAGEISYDLFCQLDAAHWRGLPVQKLEEITGAIPYQPGVREIFGHLRQRGVKTALVSTGLNLLARRVARDLGVDYCLANEVEVLAGVITGRARIRVSVDVPGLRKGDHVRQLIGELGLCPAAAFSVGDSMGDLDMFLETGRSFLVNSRPGDAAAITGRVATVTCVETIAEIKQHVAI